MGLSLAQTLSSTGTISAHSNSNNLLEYISSVLHSDDSEDVPLVIVKGVTWVIPKRFRDYFCESIKLGMYKRQFHKRQMQKIFDNKLSVEKNFSSTSFVKNKELSTYSSGRNPRP